MAEMYDDARYTVEKVVFGPAFTITAAVAGNVMVATEDIEVIEVGFLVQTSTTAPDDGASSIGVAIRCGSTTLANCSWGPVITAVGYTIRALSITDTTCIDNNDTLVFCTVGNNTAAAGAVTPFLKYKERY